MQTLEKCPYCGSTHMEKHLDCKDYSISKEDFGISKCKTCGLVWTNPRPSEAQLPGYYASDDYISHTSKATNPINAIYKLARQFTLRQKAKLLSSLDRQQQRTILDVGVGTGHLLSFLAAKGWKVTGVEKDEKARAIAMENMGDTVYEDIAQLPAVRYSIITMWHVLEHVIDVSQTITTLKGHLEKDGRLVIAVPNHESHDAIHYGHYWAGYDVPRHLYHFSKAALSRIMEDHGMKVEQILPMKLDAYYVSLLSEQYKGTGALAPLKAVQTGWASNRKAKKTTNHSSLIYIIKQNG